MDQFVSVPNAIIKPALEVAPRMANQDEWQTRREPVLRQYALYKDPIFSRFLCSTTTSKPQAQVLPRVVLPPNASQELIDYANYILPAGLLDYEYARRSNGEIVNVRELVIAEWESRDRMPPAQDEPDELLIQDDIYML